MSKKYVVEKAIMPLNDGRITAAYKNTAYSKVMKFKHYGTDMADLKRKDAAVFAPFKMKIVAAGEDTLMGGTIIGVSVNPIDIHHGPERQLTSRRPDGTLGRGVREGRGRDRAREYKDRRLWFDR